MGTQLAPLFVRVGADIKGYVAGMNQVDRKAKQSSARIAAASKIASAAIIGIGIAAVKMAADFQKNMAAVNTLLGGNIKRIKELEASVKKLAVETGKDLDDLTKGVFQVVSAFGDSADTAKLLEISAKAAAAGLATTEDAVNLISAVTKGYGDTSAEAAQKAADLAFITNKLGQTTFPELAASMGKAIPLAAALKVSQEELFGVMATLTGVTGNTAEVSTQLTAIFASMIKPSDGLKSALKELEVASFDVLVQERGLIEGLKDLVDTTDGSNEALGELFERKEALTAILALLGPQYDVFNDKLAQTKKAAGEAAKAFKIQADTFETRFNQLIQTLAVAAVEIGDALLPVAEAIVGALKAVTENVELVVAAFKLLVGLKIVSILASWSEALVELGAAASIAGKAVALLQGAVLGFVIGQALKDVIDFVKSRSLRAAMRELQEITIGGGVLRQLGDLRSKSKKELEGLVKDVEENIKKLRKSIEFEQNILDRKLPEGVFGGTIAKAKQKIAEVENRIEFLRRSLGRITEAFKTATDAVEKPDGLAGALEEVEEIIPPLIANITNLFAAINKGIEERALRGMQEFLDFLAQSAKLGTTGAFFGTGGGAVIGGGLLDFFGKELPQTFVKGWNLHVRPALMETAEETAARLAKEAQQELRTRVTIGLIDAFSDAFKGNLAFEGFLDAFKRGLKNVFTFVLQDAAKFLAEMIGGIRGQLAAAAVTFGGQLIGALTGSGGIASVIGSAVSGAIVGGQLGGPPGAVIGGALGFLGGLLGLGGGGAGAGLPTFAEAQEILAQRALEAADALASVKNVIANTNVSIFRAKLSLDQFRDSLHEARKAEREATRAIRDVGAAFQIMRGPGKQFLLREEGDVNLQAALRGGPALKEFQRLIEQAIGTGKFGFISRKEKKEILALVVGEDNEQLAEQLLEAAAARAIMEADFALQKEHLNVLRDTRRAARKTREGMTSVEEAIRSGDKDIVHAIENIPAFQSGTRFVPQTGLAIVHRGEQIIPAKGERGGAGIDAGGGRPTNLTANIFLDGKLVESVVVPVMEDAIASRETSIRVNTRERRG